MNKKLFLILFLVMDVLLIGLLFGIKSGFFASLLSTPDIGTSVSSGATTASPAATDSPASSQTIQTEGPSQTQTPSNTTSVGTDPSPQLKPRVAISTVDGHSEPTTYINAAKQAGFDYILLPMITTKEEAQQYLSLVDALIMVGGQDIAPSYYGEKALPNANLTISRSRDISDVLFIEEALEMDLPLLGICRGMQIMNVVRGGSLYQDISLQVPSVTVVHMVPYTEQSTMHSLTTVEGTKISQLLGKSLVVNSWHHQAIKTAGTNVRISAYSPLDNLPEAIELTDRTFAIGVQFHPEEFAQSGKKPFTYLFTALRDAALQYHSGV